MKNTNIETMFRYWNEIEAETLASDIDEIVGASMLNAWYAVHFGIADREDIDDR